MIAVAGVSRNAFYRLFASADECVENALARIDERIRQAVDQALSDASRSAPSRFEEAISALVRLATREPDAFRAWLADDFATPSGRQRVADVRASLERATADALSANGPPLPAAMVTAIVGGVVLTLQSRTASGDVAALTTLLPDLLAWALGYRPPSRPLPATPPLADPRALPSAPDEQAAPPERILQATAAIVAERGYEHVRVKDVAARARVSLRTFYNNFDGLERAFLSAVERHERRLLRSAIEAYRGAPTWPRAVDASLRALCDGLASDPHVARVSGLGAHESGPTARDRLTQTVGALRAFLRAGHRHHPGTRGFASEGVAATLAFTFHDHARRGRPELIRAFAPTATFIALSPFIPVAEATRIARGAS